MGVSKQKALHVWGITQLERASKSSGTEIYTPPESPCQYCQILLEKLSQKLCNLLLFPHLHSFVPCILNHRTQLHLRYKDSSFSALSPGWFSNIAHGTCFLVQQAGLPAELPAALHPEKILLGSFGKFSNILQNGSFAS